MAIPILLQYTYLLTSQLESQRLFFEEKLVRVEQLAQEEVCVCVYLADDDTLALILFVHCLLILMSGCE